MGSFVVRAVAVAVVGGALSAAPAAAADYTFVSSGGIVCTLSPDRSIGAEPDGQFTVDASASLDCGGAELSGVNLATHLTDLSGAWTSPGDDARCAWDPSGGSLPCTFWPMVASESVPDRPRGLLQHRIDVSLSLLPTGSAPHVWVVTPPGCTPGDSFTSCTITEPFRVRGR